MFTAPRSEKSLFGHLVWVVLGILVIGSGCTTKSDKTAAKVFSEEEKNARLQIEIVHLEQELDRILNSIERIRNEIAAAMDRREKYMLEMRREGAPARHWRRFEIDYDRDYPLEQQKEDMQSAVDILRKKLVRLRQRREGLANFPLIIEPADE
jgi:hypothetical protein